MGTPVPPGGPSGQGTTGSASTANKALIDMTPDELRAWQNSQVGSVPSQMYTGGQMQPNSIIYLGMGKQAAGNMPGAAGQSALEHAPSWQTMSYDQARLLPSVWQSSDPAMLKQLINTGVLNKVPGFDVNMGMPEIVSAWDDLVKASYELNQAKGSDKKWTPWDVLQTYGNNKGQYGTVKNGDWLYDAATGQKVKYVGPRSKTTTSRDVNLSSAEDVKALTTQVLTQALGRAPTTAEVAQYKSTINAQENANPTLSSTTQTFNDQGEAVAQSTKTTGGFDAAAQQQLVQDQAAGTPEYAKYQSGTTYWNALMQMLTGG